MGLIGIDLGGTQLRVAVADDRGRLKTVVRRATEAARGRQHVIDRIVATGAGALLFGGGPVLRGQLHQIVALAARHALPTIYELRDYVEAGGLISYAASFPAAYRQAGVYAGRILKGAKPSELPVLQPTKFEMIINLRTAKALGLALPAALLDRADKVIE